MSEQISNSNEQGKLEQECYKALKCLYIAVDESVAKDINYKVKDYINYLKNVPVEPLHNNNLHKNEELGSIMKEEVKEDELWDEVEEINNNWTLVKRERMELYKQQFTITRKGKASYGYRTKEIIKLIDQNKELIGQEEFKPTEENIKQEGEKLYPLDNPRKNMFHDNSGQYTRQEAFVLGAKYILKSQSISKEGKERATVGECFPQYVHISLYNELLDKFKEQADFDKMSDDIWTEIENIAAKVPPTQ